MNFFKINFDDNILKDSRRRGPYFVIRGLDSRLVAIRDYQIFDISMPEVKLRVGNHLCMVGIWRPTIWSLRMILLQLSAGFKDDRESGHFICSCVIFKVL